MASDKRRKTRVTFPIVDAQDELVWEERRTGERRRWSGGRANLPMRGADGEMVPENRRRRVDRRVRSTELVHHPDGPQLPKVLLDTGEALYELTCAEDSLVLGRSRTSDVQVESEVISRAHARIIRLGERFFLRDESTNGTYVQFADGEDAVLRGNQRRLQGRGSIRLGRTIEPHAEDLIRFVVIEEAERAATA